MQKVFKALLITLLLLVTFIACSSLGQNSEKISNTAKTVIQDALPSESLEIVSDTELTAGNYTSGIDFKAGIYNIKAIEGQGTINSNNIFVGGVSALLGVPGVSELYIPEVKNIKLPNNMEFTVTGNLKVKMIYIKTIVKK
jgi:hypothetical protein